MTTLFDTSALVAALDEGEPHHRWSRDQLVARKAEGPVVIVDIVYSELSVGMTREQVRDAVAALALERLPSADEALFLAGKAYLAYRRGKGAGKKSNVLPDFLVGAAAEAAAIPLVTANPGDFVSRFPKVRVIHP